MLLNSNLENKKVILRTDYNVPINDKKIMSSRRIDESLNTIKHILNQKPTQLIIISHLGRPANKKEFSLYPVKLYLEKKLKSPIYFSKSLEFNENHKIVLIENIRHYPEETEVLPTTEEFRNRLTQLGDVFINDAFGCCHRNHSSIIGINTKEKYLGLLVENEIKYLID